MNARACALVILLAAATAGAQSPKMIVWEPGMDHAYQDGILWLKANVPDRAVLVVSLSAGGASDRWSSATDTRAGRTRSVVRLDRDRDGSASSPGRALRQGTRLENGKGSRFSALPSGLAPESGRSWFPPDGCSGQPTILSLLCSSVRYPTKALTVALI